MQAEHKTNYFKHFIDNTPEQRIREYLDIFDLSLKSPIYDMDTYREHAESYNKFIEFWTNKDYLDILEDIKMRPYDENTRESKINILAGKYKDGDSKLHRMFNSFQDILYGFYNIANRKNATPDEKKALEMYPKYDLQAKRLIDRIREMKKMDSTKPIDPKNLNIKGLIEK